MPFKLELNSSFATLTNLSVPSNNATLIVKKAAIFFLETANHYQFNGYG
jgi:hypothetical protein